MRSTPDITKAAVRDKLKPRGEPYWRQADTGLYVGFRKNKTGLGAWIARLQEGGNKTQHKLGAVTKEFTFAKAAEAARDWARRQRQGVTKDHTVWEVVEAYLRNMATEKREAPQLVAATEKRLRFTVENHPLAKVPMSKLTSAQVLQWRNELAEDQHQGTTNRTLAALKAALSWGYQHDMAASDDVWAKVPRFRDVQFKERRYLKPEERQRLILAAPPEVAIAIKALLYTGHRPGLSGLLGACAGDFRKPTNKAPGQFYSSTRKGNRGLKRFYCELTPEASEFFTELTRDKLPTAPMFTKDGYPWKGNNRFLEAFHQAVKAAGLPSDTVPYDLRHSAISDWITQGVSVLTVAQWTGTSISMIQQTYGHLVPNSEIHKLSGYKALGE